MHNPPTARDDAASQDDRRSAEGIQRAVIRIACASFAIIAGTFAVIASALASQDQAVFLVIGLIAIGASLAVIRVELRRKRALDAQ
jgi:hypothetical protein